MVVEGATLASMYTVAPAPVALGMVCATSIICCSLGIWPLTWPTTSATDISPQLSSSDSIDSTAVQIESLGRKTLRIVSDVSDRKSLQELHDQTIAAFEEIMSEIREKGIDEDELNQIKVKFRSDFYSHLEGGMGAYMPRFGLMHYLACFTLFDNDPQLINSVLDKFLAVTSDQVREVARKMLVPQQRSVLIRRPVEKGGAQ